MECKCTNPDGGGTKCPIQHVAVCIRGKDRECYGECVPIPENYSTTTNNFNRWLSEKVKEVVLDYATQNYAIIFNAFLEQMSKSDRDQGGKITFRFGNVLIYTQFSYEFKNDIEPLGGQLKYSVR
jgi:hypothetical protein